MFLVDFEKNVKMDLKRNKVDPGPHSRPQVEEKDSYCAMVLGISMSRRFATANTL